MIDHEYWIKREEKQRSLDVRNDKEISARIQEIYEDSIKSIAHQINEFYIRYARKNGLSMAEAKEMADSIDIMEYAKLAKEYVSEKDFSELANRQMSIYNLSMKTNRLDLLMMNLNAEMVSTTSEIEDILQEAIEGRGYEEVERQAGILGQTVYNTAPSVKVIANASFQSATWSERLWKNQAVLREKVGKVMSENLIQGISTPEQIRQIETVVKRDVNNASYVARRLVVTERQRVAKQVQMQIFEDCGIELYEFLSEPECCPVCARLTGKKFKVSEQQAGVNLAPMHPQCRCSATLTLSGTDEDYDEWLDTFSDHGMPYDEWLQKKESDKN